MTTPLLKRVRVMGAKIESTVGTQATPTGSEAVFNAFDVDINPNIDFEQRESQGSLSQLSGTMGGSIGQMKFKTDCYGGASDPQWASTLLAGCGMVGASHVYTFVSKAPGVSGGPKTITLGVWENGKLKVLVGAMGTAVFTFMAGKRVVIEWTFTGKWVTPIDASIISPTYPTTAPLRFVSSGLTLAAFTPRTGEMTLDLGCQVEMREDSTDASGYQAAVVTGRRPVGKIKLESNLVADYAPYSLWLARTEQALAMTLGSSGNQVAFAAPKLQITNVQEGDNNGVQCDEIDFQLNYSSAGDDELSITIG